MLQSNLTVSILHKADYAIFEPSRSSFSDSVYDWLSSQSMDVFGCRVGGEAADTTPKRKMLEGQSHSKAPYSNRLIHINGEAILA